MRGVAKEELKNLLSKLNACYFLITVFISDIFVYMNKLNIIYFSSRREFQAKGANKFNNTSALNFE